MPPPHLPSMGLGEVGASLWGAEIGARVPRLPEDFPKDQQTA